jgi:hypothetical protein
MLMTLEEFKKYKNTGKTPVRKPNKRKTAKMERLRIQAEEEYINCLEMARLKEEKYQEALKSSEPWAIERKQYLEKYKKATPNEDAFKHRLPGGYGTGRN